MKTLLHFEFGSEEQGLGKIYIAAEDIFSCLTETERMIRYHLKTYEDQIDSREKEFLLNLLLDISSVSSAVSS
jgi:hypothetical protein